MPRRVVVDSDSDSDGKGVVLGVAAGSALGLGVAMLEASSDDEEELFGTRAPPDAAVPTVNCPAEEGCGAITLEVESASESESDGPPFVAPYLSSRTCPQREASVAFRTMYGESAGAGVAPSAHGAERSALPEADGFDLSFDDDDETEDEDNASQRYLHLRAAASPLPRPSVAPSAAAHPAAVTVTLAVRSGSALSSLGAIVVRGSGEHGTVIGREACAELPSMVLLGGDPEVSSTHARLEVPDVIDD